MELYLLIVALVLLAAVTADLVSLRIRDIYCPMFVFELRERCRIWSKAVSPP
jgi:hypothetical protein